MNRIIISLGATAAAFLLTGAASPSNAHGRARPPAASRVQTACDKACLEEIGAKYRQAYLAHDPSRAPFAKHVRYTENNVEMPFPDGTWDTVTKELGPAITLSDPVTGNVGIYTTIEQRQIPGYLAVRLKIENRKITEVEHIISTKRNLSSPPTPFGDFAQYQVDPDFMQIVPPAQRVSRAQLIAHANGYFDTLQHNNGQIRGTCFNPTATRRENGMTFKDIGGGFRSGRYAFNDRVRREVVLVDEARQVVMARGFIDHKGVMDEYYLTTGEKTKSIFQEPQSWALLEAFAVRNTCIDAVVANFYQAPYYTVSPWTKQGR